MASRSPSVSPASATTSCSSKAAWSAATAPTSDVSPRSRCCTRPASASTIHSRGPERSATTWRAGRTRRWPTHERIHLVRGWASLTDSRDPHVVRVDGGDATVFVRAEHVVIAGGSRPVTIDIDGLDADRVVTNEELFELDAPPASSADRRWRPDRHRDGDSLRSTRDNGRHRRAPGPTPLHEDPLITEVVEQSLRSQGVTLHLGTTDRAHRRRHRPPGRRQHGRRCRPSADGRRPTSSTRRAGARTSRRRRQPFGHRGRRLGSHLGRRDLGGR